MGLRQQLRGVGSRLGGVADMFSLALIPRTLFAPFRQIGTSEVRGSLDARFRAWGDKQFSRAVGAVVRSVTFVVGVVALLVAGVVSVLWVVVWMVMPGLPVLGLDLMGMKWMPW